MAPAIAFAVRTINSHSWWVLVLWWQRMEWYACRQGRDAWRRYDEWITVLNGDGILWLDDMTFIRRRQSVPNSHLMLLHIWHNGTALTLPLSQHVPATSSSCPTHSAIVTVRNTIIICIYVYCVECRESGFTCAHPFWIFNAIIFVLFRWLTICWPMTLFCRRPKRSTVFWTFYLVTFMVFREMARFWNSLNFEILEYPWSAVHIIIYTTYYRGNGKRMLSYLNFHPTIFIRDICLHCAVSVAQGMSTEHK